MSLIITHPASDDYRKGWDEIFGRKPSLEHKWIRFKLKVLDVLSKLGLIPW